MGRMIKHTVSGAAASAFVSKLPYFDTTDTGLWGRTPECKLNSGFCAPNTHTFSCMTDVLKGVY